MEGMPVGAEALIARLQKAIDATLSHHLLSGGPVALVDYPDHSNVGDSAIWLGEIAYLQKKVGGYPDYYCTIANFAEADLKKRAPQGPILIHGGGNFGTIWRHHQDFRIHLMKRFPGRPIIQLPQSIHFADDAAIAETACAIRAHGAFTLLVRDQKSFDFARAHFECPAHLCPDMAFCIGCRPRQSPHVDLVYLLRTDVESKGDLRAPDTRESKISLDWLAESKRHRRRTRVYATLRGLLSGGSRFARIKARNETYAWNHFWRGAGILSQGKVVITDRLHGHIISMLLDIPHVVLDNSYGKLSGFISAWTSDFTGLRRAATMDEAVAEARALIAMRR
jgi:pyruvyl transferase EpsO